MSLIARLGALDRRIIFVVVTAGIILPMIFPIKLPILVTPEVKALWDRIETLKPGDPVLLTAEYDPGTTAEMDPMMQAMLRHLFRKNARVIVVCLYSTGVSLIDQSVSKIADEMHKVKGVDWTYLGYKPYPNIVIQSLGQDFRLSFPRDYYGADTDSLPVMQGIKNYNSLKFVLTINATSGVDYWLQYGQTKYGFPLAIGVTAVMATDYYSTLQSKQIFALVGGMKGAAEYEVLVDAKGYATRVMNIQSVVHAVIVGFILLGNIAYLAQGGRLKLGGRA